MSCDLCRGISNCPACAPDDPIERIQYCTRPGCWKPAVFVTQSDRFLCEDHRES